MLQEEGNEEKEEEGKWLTAAGQPSLTEEPPPGSQSRVRRAGAGLRGPGGRCPHLPAPPGPPRRSLSRGRSRRSHPAAGGAAPGAGSGRGAGR